MTDPVAALGLEALLDTSHPLKHATASWAASELAQRDRVAADRDSTFAADDWRRCAEHGIQGLIVPEEHGGQGRDLISALLVLEGLGYGCRDNGLAYAVTSQIISTQLALDRFGTVTQKQRWLPGMCDGSVKGAFAISEVGAGSDPFSLEATASRRDDGSYHLVGEKAYITLAPLCDVAIVFASTSPDLGQWGVSAFIVPVDQPGVERSPNREKMGMRTTPFGNLRFDVIVDESSLLGREGAGASIFTATIEAERAFVYATKLGMMERQLDQTIEYARTRVQSGRPIGAFQAVGHRVADMKLRHEAARLLLYKAALLVIADRPSTLAAALAKLAASEAAVESSLDATRIHGAKGYVSEFEVERDLRDAIGGLVYSGTSEVQRNIVARLLGLP